tara:strand:- start:129 stop:446 length:318 start_codon:yes stop_codon:yes gene_type:complete
MRVTDHAVLRYLERVEGFDIEDLRRQLGESQTLKLASVLGNGEYPIGKHGEGVLVVHNDAVVTVIGSETRTKGMPAAEAFIYEGQKDYLQRVRREKKSKRKRKHI